MASDKRNSPGTTVRGGVRSTMGGGFQGKGVSGGEGVGGGLYNKNKAPFDTPRSMKGGGVPVKFFDGLTAKMPTTKTAGQVSPRGTAVTQKVGERRFRNPK